MKRRREPKEIHISRELPIIFSGPMVRAILDGRKTQTRRVTKHLPHKLKYRIGDHLWVKETWAPSVLGCPGGLSYRADHINPAGDGPANPMKWHPSIFMPRRYSRITLEVLGVRAEILKEISADDICNEGVGWYEWNGKWREGECLVARRKSWIELWNSINGKKPGCSWQDNPWVEVIMFREES